MNTITLNSIIPWGELAMRSKYNFQDPYEHLAQRVVPEIEATEDKLKKEQQRISWDDRLTVQGKQEQLRAVAEQEIKPIVEKYSKDEKTARRSADEHVQDMQKAEFSHLADDFKAELRQQEIRNQLSQMKKSDILKLFNQANEKEDMEFIRAVENTPLAFPLVPVDIVENLRNERLKNKFPEKMGRVEDLRTISDFYAMVVKSFSERYDKLQAGQYKK